MKEFSGGLLQEDTTLLESAVQDVSQVPVVKTEENKEVGRVTRWFSWLKKVSFGQYRTPLYYKK
jgi:hypothetical protein